MNTLTADRTALAAGLEAALAASPVNVCAVVPEALHPPCLIIQAADPYLTPGDTFAGEWAVAYDLILAADLLTNAQAVEDLEALIPPVLAAVESTAYAVDNVTRAGPVHTAEWVAHAITLTVSRYITL